MALYYFHVRTDRGLVEDEEGIELPHMEAVMNEAIVSAAEFAAEATSSGPLAFEVADELGRIVLRMPVQSLATAWQRLVGLAPGWGALPLH